MSILEKWKMQKLKFFFSETKKDYLITFEMDAQKRKLISIFLWCKLYSEPQFSKFPVSHTIFIQGVILVKKKEAFERRFAFIFENCLWYFTGKELPKKIALSSYLVQKTTEEKYCFSFVPKKEKKVRLIFRTFDETTFSNWYNICHKLCG